ncbi:hypothetical protein, partial [Bacteroides bouchesdurhonensis]
TRSNLCRVRLEFIGLLLLKSNRKDRLLSRINITYPQDFRTDPIFASQLIDYGIKRLSPSSS